MGVCFDYPRVQGIRKAQGNLRVDLSGIAKGYAVDRLAAMLDGHGMPSYLVDIGGELRSRGHKPDGSSWRVGVERPVPGTRAIHRTLPLENRAIATSGDYRSFFLHEGHRYTHAIDPRTARPVTHALASATVIDSDAMRADALSTALMIMRPDEGLELARSHDVAAYLIVRSGDEFEGGTYYLQTGSITAQAILAGAYVGAPASAVLVVNNHRDRAEDLRAGRRTLAIVAGEAPSKALYAGLLAVPFLLLPVLGEAGRFWWWLPLLLAPLALALARRLWAERIGLELNVVLARTAQLQLVLGVALVCAWLLPRSFS